MPNLWEQFSDEQLEDLYRRSDSAVKSQINAEVFRREKLEAELPPLLISENFPVPPAILPDHPWFHPPTSGPLKKYRWW